MDIKKWAGSRLGMASASDEPGGAPRQGFPGMYGPAGTPLFGAIKAADLPPMMAQWAQAGGKAPEHPAGAPAWAANHEAYENAVALVKKHWEQYDEPWAVVAYAYDCLKDLGGAKPAMPAPGAPGMPKPGMPPGVRPPIPPGMAPKSPVPPGIQ